MKKTLLLLGASAAVLTASAQYTNYSNFKSDSRFGDNWSIGIEGGIQTNLNQWNNPQGAVFGVNFNKDLTPYFGLSVEALAGANNTGNWLDPARHYHNGTAIDNLAGFLVGRWNVSNSLGGFPGHRRVFEIETELGAGYGGFFANTAYADRWSAFLVKAGLDFNFYLGKARAWSINIRPGVIWDISATGKFDSRHAVAQLTAGVTYHFKTSNGTHYFINSDAQALKDEIAALTALNADLEAQLANQPVVAEQEVVVEKVVEEVPTYIDSTYVVNFAWNSAELVPAAKATLDNIPTDATVSIAGYASPEGNAQYNLQLSDRRADAVKTYLQNRGIKIADTVGYGANNAESNRIVIVTIK